MNQHKTEGLSLTRVFDAPRELVFKAWTEVDRFKEWFGPKAWTIPMCEIDLKVGGSTFYCMEGPNGFKMYGKFEFTEIDEPAKLVFKNSITDEEGNPIPAPGKPNWPKELVTSLTFVEEDGKTTLTLTAKPLDPTAEQAAAFKEMKDGMSKGWVGSFAKLEEHLAAG